mmetsp:Transcript_10979/g.33947  ORF Transcript_10979/g.33947 Transcript_10979/m.33947 type:complete len:244 (+) Transcript_10979:992-1723(+)
MNVAVSFASRIRPRIPGRPACLAQAVAPVRRLCPGRTRLACRGRTVGHALTVAGGRCRITRDVRESSPTVSEIGCACARQCGWHRPPRPPPSPFRLVPAQCQLGWRLALPAHPVASHANRVRLPRRVSAPRTPGFPPHPRRILPPARFPLRMHRTTCCGRLDAALPFGPTQTSRAAARYRLSPTSPHDAGEVVRLPRHGMMPRPCSSLPSTRGLRQGGPSVTFATSPYAAHHITPFPGYSPSL